MEAGHTGSLEELWIPEDEHTEFPPTCVEMALSPAAITEPENSYIWYRYSSYILLTSVHKLDDTNRQKIILWPKEGCQE